MRRSILIAIAGLGVGLLIGPATGVASNAKPQPSSAVEQRLAQLEKKLTNLERMLGVALDDDRKVNEFVRERERAMVEARAMSLLSQLQTIRSQLELYQVQHHGVYPDLTGKGWAQLTRTTDTQGNIVSRGARGYGPYLKTPPKNTLTGRSKVVGSRKDIGPDAGWAYNQKTGAIYAIVPAAVAEQYGYEKSDVITY